MEEKTGAKTDQKLNQKLEAEVNDKILSYRDKTDGKTKILRWDDIATGNELPHDFFKTADEKLTPIVAGYDSVIIEFDPDYSFAGIEKFEFELSRAFKTIGTYITKCNKIANGVNPESTQAYAARSKVAGTKTHGVSKIGEDSIKIFSLANNDDHAVLEFDEAGNFKKLIIAGEYEKLSYYAQAVIESNKWMNRIQQLLEFDEAGNICDSPKYYLKFKNQKIELGESYTEAELATAKKQLILNLFDNETDFSMSEIAKLEPEKIGGGKQWFMNWLVSHKLAKVNRSVKS